MTQTATIQIDRAENFVALQAFAAQYVRTFRQAWCITTGERPMFEMYQIDDEIEKPWRGRVLSSRAAAT